MANTITLPTALSRSPYDHLTIRNGSNTNALTVSTDGTDTIESTGGPVTTMTIYPMNAVTIQSNGVDAWARIGAYSLATQINNYDLVNDHPLDTTWQPVPGLSHTNDRASGVYMFTGYFPCDVDAGNNQNIGFSVRAVLNGTPLPEFDVWQDRAASVQLNISVAVPQVFDLGDVLVVESRQIPGTQGSYTLLGSVGGGDYAAFQVTGPL